VPVLRDFELVTMMITHSRPEFTCQHGRVVNSPDVLGQKFGLHNTFFLVIIAIIIIIIIIIIVVVVVVVVVV